MICRKCNFILQGSEKFCPNCGAPYYENTQTEKDQENNPLTPPSILFPSPKIPEAEKYQSRIFRDELPEDEEELMENSGRKKSKAPAFLITLFILIVVIAGSFLFMEYSDLAPAIAGYLENGATNNQQESITTTAAISAETTLGDYNDFYGVVSPDINYKPTICYVASDSLLALRKGPDDSYALISNLRVGFQLQVIGGTATNNTWVYVYVPFIDCYGWLNSSFLSRASALEENTTQNETSTEPETTEEAGIESQSFSARVFPESGLKLREGPGLDYEVILTVPMDDTVVVLGNSEEYSGWIYVSYNGYTGYMDGTYLEKL